MLHTSACHHHLFTPQLPLAAQIDFHRGDFDCDMTVVFTFLHACAIKNLSGVYNVFYSTGKCNDSSVTICITVLQSPSPNYSCNSSNWRQVNGTKSTLHSWHKEPMNNYFYCCHKEPMNNYYYCWHKEPMNNYYYCS